MVYPPATERFARNVASKDVTLRPFDKFAHDIYMDTCKACSHSCLLPAETLETILLNPASESVSFILSRPFALGLCIQSVQRLTSLATEMSVSESAGRFRQERKVDKCFRLDIQGVWLASNKFHLQSLSSISNSCLRTTKAKCQAQSINSYPASSHYRLS